MPTNRSNDEKLNLHLRNRNRKRYDLNAMTVSHPELIKFIQPNKRGANSINFSDHSAVRMLNKAILNYYYGIEYWEFPKENLCPPIPGRAEYIHHVADLLSENSNGKIPMGKGVTCLDIGSIKRLCLGRSPVLSHLQAAMETASRFLRRVPIFESRHEPSDCLRSRRSSTQAFRFDGGDLRGHR